MSNAGYVFVGTGESGMVENDHPRLMPRVQRPSQLESANVS